MEWVSLEDRWPEKGKDVLCLSQGRVFHSWWDDVSSQFGDWYDIQNSWIIEDVTHWMPLPEPPGSM